MTDFRPPTASDFAPPLSTDQMVQAVQTTTVGYIPLTVVTADGDLIIGSGLNAVTRLGIGGSGGLLYSNGAEPAWLAQGARGSLLEVGGSGTGWLAIGTRGSLLYAGANDPQYLTIGTQGSILTAGASDPAWLSPGTSGYVLTSNGAGAAPTWTAPTAAILSSGLRGQILYNSADATAAWLTVGAAGTILVGSATIPKYLAAGSAGGGVLYTTGPGNDPAWSASTTSGALLLGQNGAAPQWLAAVARGQILVSDGTATNPKYLAAPSSSTSGVGQVLTSQGAPADPAWAIPIAKALYQQAFDIVSTSTATTMFTQSIPGNTLSATSTILVYVEADYFNNSGGGRDITLLVSLGGTTLWSDATSGSVISANAVHRGFAWRMQIANEASASAQRMSGDIRIGAAVAGTGGGLGHIIASGDLANNTIGGASAVDTTSSQTLLLQATHSANNASLELKGQVTVLVV